MNRKLAGDIDVATAPVENSVFRQTPLQGMPSSELLGKEADDAGNAQFMHRFYGERFLYCPAFGWLEWVGTHWRAGADALVVRAAVNSLRRRRHLAVDAMAEEIVRTTRANGQRVSACVQLFRALVTEPDVEAFDKDPDLLNCLNGVVNLRTRSLSQHCPRQRFTYVVPVSWDPDADMAEWHNFIHAAVGNDDVICHFLQRAIGYAFTGHTREEVLFYLYGPPRAGKGTLAETIQALLPHPISAAVDFNTFTARRDGDTQNFDLAPLRPSRIVFASESNRYQALNPAKIKQLTGGDFVYCAYKHRDHFRYRPQYVVFLLSNHEVNGDPEDDALWGRVLVVPFPISHLGDEDKGLKERLRRPEHLQGLLRWVVEGAAAWYEGGLKLPAAITKVTKEQRDAQDYARQWAAECCEQDEKEWTASRDLMESYQKWCEANNLKARTPKDLAASLRRLGCLPEKRQGQRGFSGIALRRTAESGQQAGSGQWTARTAESDYPEYPHDHEGEPPIQVSVLSTVQTDELMFGEGARRIRDGRDSAAVARLRDAILSEMGSERRQWQRETVAYGDHGAYAAVGPGEEVWRQFVGQADHNQLAAATIALAMRPQLVARKDLVDTPHVDYDGQPL
jgi:putative DNA primase/helicase